MFRPRERTLGGGPEFRWRFPARSVSAVELQCEGCMKLASSGASGGAHVWRRRTRAFRPPAVPLITHDPYFSVWSMADTLTRDGTRHWTGALQSMTALARIDGKTVRLMGAEPRQFPPLRQKSVEVLPTRTVYRFEGEGIRLDFTFLTPALPDDLEVLSRP